MSTRHDHTAASRGFSLVEVLLATFILAIGIIAVAALFPAGISQQRRSVDDIIGPIVANNAIAILRTRLRQQDFGTMEEHGFYEPLPMIHGDWSWRRPGFYLKNTQFSLVDPITGDSYSEPVFAGSISVFDSTNAPTTTLEAPGPAGEIRAIPWNSSLYGFNDGPVIIFSQGERYYPMQTQQTGTLRPPQYAWDCMFRRYQGRILVAIFVYRVTAIGGGSIPYTVPPNPADSSISPLPTYLPLVADITGSWASAWDAWGLTFAESADDRFVFGTAAGATYNPQNLSESWQEPRQWLLDQNNNVHRVLSRTPETDDNNAEVEFVRPIPTLPDLPTYVIDRSSPVVGAENIVTDIWFIPAEVMLDMNVNDDNFTGTQPALLTPVYVTVREL